MDKAQCYKDQIVYFTCDGRGRGGHYSVRAIVTKVNSKNALLTELPGSYRPGTRWNWPISELRTAEQDRTKGAQMVAELRQSFPELFKGL